VCLALLAEFIFKTRVCIMRSQKDWQSFFNIELSKIIVIDRKGQRTADGNTEKYDNTYDFSDSMNHSIRQMFRINWEWTRTELGITITKAEIVPVANNNGNFYGKTTEQVENIRKIDINYAKHGVNSLCRLSYTSIDDKIHQEKIIPAGIFLPYYGSLEFFPKRVGHSLAYSANDEKFQNIVKMAFRTQITK